MKRLLIPLILFSLLVFEGVAIDFLPGKFIGTEIMIVPHWVLIFLILVSVFYDQESTIYAIVYGVIFGLFIDVVYTSVLGVYMFIYPLGIYITHLLKRVFQRNIYMTMVIAVIVLSIVEIALIFIYSLVGIADSLSWGFLEYRLLPTIIANIIILLVLYPLFSKRLMRWKIEQEDR